MLAKLHQIRKSQSSSFNMVLRQMHPNGWSTSHTWHQLSSSLRLVLMSGWATTEVVGTACSINILMLKTPKTCLLSITLTSKTWEPKISLLWLASWHSSQARKRSLTLATQRVLLKCSLVHLCFQITLHQRLTYSLLMLLLLDLITLWAIFWSMWLGTLMKLKILLLTMQACIISSVLMMLVIPNLNSARLLHSSATTS